MRLPQILAIALAGALGSVCRFGVSGLAYRLLGQRFAYGTLAVNLLGCLLIGAILETALLTELIRPAWRMAVTVGFLGAFTTFSTFSYETLRYLEDGAWALASLNLAANLLIGIPLTWLGIVAARVAFGGR